MSSEIEIEQIMSSLAQISSDSSASEAHGILCGLVCAKGNIEPQEWLQHIAPERATGDLLALQGEQLLQRFFMETIASLADSNMKFYPLLPDDENPLICLEAIAQWAQGFLMGLSLAGIQITSAIPDDVEDFIETMVSISDADSYELAGDESDEQAIVELIEFIRIGVLLSSELLSNEKLNPIKMPIDTQDTNIH